MVFKQLSLRTQLILLLQAIGMLMGTSTHLMWILQHGFLSEEYHAPVFTRLFWDSLTFLDPLAAVLLIIKPKVGVWLTLAIILADVIHNNLFYLDELYIHGPGFAEWFQRYWMIAGQMLFAGFVLLTLKGNLKDIRQVPS